MLRYLDSKMLNDFYWAFQAWAKNSAFLSDHCFLRVMVIKWDKLTSNLSTEFRLPDITHKGHSAVQSGTVVQYSNCRKWNNGTHKRNAKCVEKFERPYCPFPVLFCAAVGELLNCNWSWYSDIRKLYVCKVQLVNWPLSVERQRYDDKNQFWTIWYFAVNNDNFLVVQWTRILVSYSENEHESRQKSFYNESQPDEFIISILKVREKSFWTLTLYQCAHLTTVHSQLKDDDTIENYVTNNDCPDL